MNMRLIDLLRNTGIDCPPQYKELEINGVSYDSRKVRKGNVFICLKGKNTDGHIYAIDAAIRGAAVIISEQDLEFKSIPVLKTEDCRKTLTMVSANFYGHPAEEMAVFGITGTNGKTTVSYMLKCGLEAAGRECGLIGTISYKIGNIEYEATHTTPESLDLQGIFYEMKGYGIRNCVMEVSSHALQLGRVSGIPFDYGVFTNLSQDHMDFHKDKEEYYQAKKKLFESAGIAGIINIDDDYGKRLYNELEAKEIRRISCSLKDKKADYYGELLTGDERGSEFALYYKEETLGVLAVSLPGIFSIYNALVAAGCLHAAGVPFTAIAKGLSSLKGVPGRFEPVENSKNISVIIDYAHTPDALEKVLSTAAEITKGRLICVFGCGGDRDRSKRPVMGKYGQYSITAL